MGTKKHKRHKCHVCSKVRQERFMSEDISLDCGVDVRTLYPDQNKGSRVKWICGDCEEENRGTIKKPR